MIEEAQRPVPQQSIEEHGIAPHKSDFAVENTVRVRDIPVIVSHFCVVCNWGKEGKGGEKRGIKKKVREK